MAQIGNGMRLLHQTPERQFLKTTGNRINWIKQPLKDGSLF